MRVNDFLAFKRKVEETFNRAFGYYELRGAVEGIRRECKVVVVEGIRFYVDRERSPINIRTVDEVVGDMFIAAATSLKPSTVRKETNRKAKHHQHIVDKETKRRMKR